jgi:hypothetical protein
LYPIWEIDVLFALRQSTLEENEENQDERRIRTDTEQEGVGAGREYDYLKNDGGAKK